MLFSALGGLCGSGGTTAFLGRKPGFFRSSEFFFICLLVFCCPYLCLYYVAIQGTPTLVLCLCGAQRITRLQLVVCLWDGKAQGEWVEVIRKISMVHYFSSKWNPCHRFSYMLKHRNPCESVLPPCVFFIKVLQVCLTTLWCPVSYLMTSSYLSDSETKSKERSASTSGGRSWQRNGLTLPPFWSESCPCKTTGNSVRIASPATVFFMVPSKSMWHLKCGEQNFYSMKLWSRGWQDWGTYVVGESTVGKHHSGLFSRTPKDQGPVSFPWVPHCCFIIPGAGKQALNFTWIFLSFKDHHFLPYPRTSLCMYALPALM